MAMRDETKSLVEYLWTLPWYENMGRADLKIDYSPIEYIRCATFEESCICAMGQEWIDVRKNDRQAIQKMMLEYSKEYFGQSGVNFSFEIAAIAKEIYEQRILPKFENFNLPQNQLLRMMGDVNGILNEKENEWLGTTGFYTKNILFWHEKGVYPCGWIGENYPDGKMIIY